MTKEQFQTNIEIKKEMEFSFHGKKYNITYGSNAENKPYIQIARLYEGGERYSCLKEMLAECKIDNTFLKEMIDDIVLI